MCTDNRILVIACSENMYAAAADATDATRYVVRNAEVITAAYR
jgi:hypothetical protein